MKWLNELCGIPVNSTLNVSIPKEKLVANIRTKFVQMAAARELDYIEDIIYHAIFRDVVGREVIDELHIIEVKLREPKYVKAIAEAFQQAIPYSQLIIFSSSEKYLLFESNDSTEPITQIQFSDWVYEEELLIDYSFGIRREPGAIIDPRNYETWNYLPKRLSDIFRAATCSGYLCMRRLIDILRIREMQYEKELIHPILAKLIEYGKIEYFDDTPFVTWSDADSIYGRLFPYKFWPSIKDGRFGINRRFEPLSTGDFASYEETLNLLEEIECSIPNHGYDPERYSVEDDEYNDNPERYGDDEDYDYIERYDEYD